MRDVVIFVIIFGLAPMIFDAAGRDTMHAPGLTSDSGTVHART